MPETLLDFLHRQYPTAKRETLRQMIRDGRVTVNGTVPRTAKLEVGTDDRVEVSDRGTRPRRPAHNAANLPFGIVHEDADVLVVDKPPGLLTSTTPGERRPTLLAAVRAYVLAKDSRARLGLIHRLDRDAGGLLVFSKNDLAYQSLKSQFFHHTVERVYLALTDGIPTPREARVESWLEERADGTVYSVRAEPGARKGERAVTHYEVIGTEGKRRALVRVRLETGRKHQIRVHLAQRGTPIVGDTMYGKDDDEKPATRLMLAAVKLGFTHPRTGEPVVFELPAPAGFALDAQPG
jgi:23S rRNA pseudouridine1911/1915/1917 synthase